MLKFLETKIPPPLVAVLFAALMWVLCSMGEPLQLPFGIRAAAAVLLLVIGEGISMSGMWAFRRAKTTINPFKPNAASALVTGGIYRYTRNPMYVGLLVMLMGWAAFLANPLALLPLPFFVLYIGRFQIAPEERVLSSIFGSEYDRYRARIRRWL